MNQLRVEEVEDSLIGHLKAKLADVTNIGSLTIGDFDEDDNLFADLPAIRLLFRSGKLNVARDQTALTYGASLEWAVLVGAEDLSTREAERTRALEVVSRVLDALAGARLANLPSHDQHPQVVLRSVDLFQTGARGTWYAVSVGVEGLTQYEANAAAA